MCSMLILVIYQQVRNLEIISSSSSMFLGSIPFNCAWTYENTKYFTCKCRRYVPGDPYIAAEHEFWGEGGGSPVPMQDGSPQLQDMDPTHCHGLGMYLCVPIVPIRYEYLSNGELFHNMNNHHPIIHEYSQSSTSCLALEGN